MIAILRHMLVVCALSAVIQPAAVGAGSGDGRPTEARRYSQQLVGIIHHRMLRAGAGLNVSGVAKVKFGIDKSGRVVDASIVERSEFPQIDARALRAVPVGFRFPPPPPAFENSVTHFVVPMQFMLGN